jgi:Domain of unknown function (DUF4145)
MAEYVANCPRCRASKTTFDVLSTAHVGTQYSWQRRYEAFCLCRHCSRTTTFVIVQRNSGDGDALEKNAPETIPGSIDNYFELDGYISLKDAGATEPPDHVPPDLVKIFEEATKCVAVGCWNAAGAMFRLCVDMATEHLLPKEDVEGLTAFIRKNLGPRLEWLFENNKLPAEIAGLSECIREDGNDAAHRGALGKVDAEDLQDFTFALLKRMFTDPESLKLAELRRQERRKPSGGEKNG